MQTKVVVEGGNLGFTQLGRVEYSLRCGNMFTDFIDNSAGVDCSDHEVNIKILLHKLVVNNEITLEQRNQLLVKMSDEVAALVLRDNYEQTQMLSLEASVSAQTLDLFRRYILELEKTNRINRQLEFLPDDKKLAERQAEGKGLTRPELAILLAYSTMYLKQEILGSTLPEDPWFVTYLESAFPRTLCEGYGSYMLHHSLRREIIATQLSKKITNHMGINFVERLQRETGALASFVIRAFSIVTGIFNIDSLWEQIEALDNKVPIAAQQKMMLQIYYLTRRSTRWILRNAKPTVDIAKTIEEFSQPIAELIEQAAHLTTDEEQAELNAGVDALIEQGVPVELARNTANCFNLFTSLDIVEAARKKNAKVTDMAKIYYAIGSHFELNWLRDQMNSFVTANLWDELARSIFRDDLDRVQRKLTTSVYSLKKEKLSIDEKIESWLRQHKFIIERWKDLIAETKAVTQLSFVTYSVVIRELFDLAKAD